MGIQGGEHLAKMFKKPLTNEGWWGGVVATRYVSVIDLLSFEESREIVVNEDWIAFYSMMHDIGFDIDYGIDYQVCYHRPLVAPSKVVYTGRWVGEERYDREWVESGNCSEEMRMSRMFLKDPELVKELERMSAVPNFTMMAIEKAKDGWVEEYWEKE